MSNYLFIVKRGEEKKSLGWIGNAAIFCLLDGRVVRMIRLKKYVAYTLDIVQAYVRLTYYHEK